MGGSGDADPQVHGRRVCRRCSALQRVVLAVAFMEFQARKVNSVQEVNDGLGIRVVGELPNISGRAFRRVRGGKGQNVLKALMAERIDGTRTALDPYHGHRSAPGRHGHQCRSARRQDHDQHASWPPAWPAAVGAPC